MIELLLLFAAGCAAGLVNVLAAGGSLLTLPTLLFLGLDAPTANGTNRVAILCQNAVAVRGFHHLGLTNLREGVLMGLMTLPGAVAGAFIALEVDETWFRRILALVITFSLWGLFLAPKPTGDADTPLPSRPWLKRLSLLGIGFYGGFIQAGVGLLIMTALCRLVERDLIRVNAHKVIIVMTYTLPSLLVFSLSGNVDWLLGIGLTLGNVSGAWIATRIAVKGGERLIKGLLAVVLIAMAIKLAF